MDLPHLRALSFGELLDQTFTYFRQHFWLFVAIMAIPQATILIVDLGWAGFERAFLLNASGTPSTVPGTHFIDTTLAGSIVVAITIFVVYAVALGATAFAVSEIHLGRTTTAHAAYQRVRERFWSLIGLIAAVSLRVLLVFLLLSIVVAVFPVLGAGLVKSRGGFAVALVFFVAAVGYVVAVFFGIRFALRYGCTIPALLLENLKIGSAIKRSITLTKSQLGRIFLIGLLMSIVTYMVGLLLEGPFLFAEMYAVIKHHTHPAFWLTACSAIMGSVGYVVTGPLLMIGLVLFYYDVRVRKEGFDLQVMMSALDSKEPVPGASMNPPQPAAPEFERTGVALVVLLTVITFGLYYPLWFMRRRTGINGLKSREKLGFGVFAVVFGVLLLDLLLNAAQGYFTFLGINWLRVTDGMVWVVSGVLLLVQAFKVRRILEEHLAHSEGGAMAGSTLLTRESSPSGVATFFFGIFYLQHKLNIMLEVCAESQPDVGTGTVPAI